jgi:hypothetical protein
MADPIQDPALDRSIKDSAAVLSKLLEAQQAGQLAPGAGGWTPPPWFPYAAAGGLAALAVAGTLVTGPITPALVIAAIAAGGSTGLTALLGIKSAGPRQP